MLTRRTQRATDARQEWSRRFEHAHALAFSSDLKEAASGLKLIEALSRERWVTDEDRATAVSILSSLISPESWFCQTFSVAGTLAANEGCQSSCHKGGSLSEYPSPPVQAGVSTCP